MQQVERRDVTKNGLSPVKDWRSSPSSLWPAEPSYSSPATTPSPSPPDPPTTQPATLTEAEAISTFEGLSATLNSAIRERNYALLKDAVVLDSPVYRRAFASIQELDRRGAVDQSNVQTISVNVLRSTQSTYQLIEVNRLDPCFVSDAGKDVTERHVVTRQSVIWTIKLTESNWLISNAEVSNQKVLEVPSGKCP